MRHHHYYPFRYHPHYYLVIPFNYLIDYMMHGPLTETALALLIATAIQTRTSFSGCLTICQMTCRVENQPVHLLGEVSPGRLVCKVSRCLSALNLNLKSFKQSEHDHSLAFFNLYSILDLSWLCFCFFA